MQLPEPLLIRLQNEIPEVLPELLASLLSAVPLISFRANRAKSTPFRDKPLEQIPWCELAYWLSKRPSFTLDPAFQAGAYYVQESSSMVIQQLLRQLPNYDVAIDLCAAPGGKTTILAQAVQVTNK